MKYTNLDFAILGLLSQQPQTGYRIRKVFETTALGNFSSSPGSIYPAIKRLLKGDLVEAVPNKTPSGGTKDILQISENGTERLKEWLTQPIVVNDLMRNTNILYLRFAFMEDLLSKSEILQFLEAFLAVGTGYIKLLEDYHKNEAANMQLLPRLSFEHGIDMYKLHMKWCRSTIKVINNKI